MPYRILFIPALSGYWDTVILHIRPSYPSPVALTLLGHHESQTAVVGLRNSTLCQWPSSIWGALDWWVPNVTCRF